ncbi:Serine--tRNA ligase [Candidatus Hepatincolaceae symbiont of Richtersius coronifer]
MINIKLIREFPHIVGKSLKDRGVSISINDLINLDLNLREKQLFSQSLAAKRNKLAKDIGIYKAQKKDITALLEEVSQSKKEEEQLVLEVKEIEKNFQQILASIPNIALATVPLGVDENDNVEVRNWGNIPKYDFTPKEHFILGKDLGMMEFEKATEISGSRFVILKGDLSLLERALYNFMLDLHTGSHNFKEHSMPVVVKSNSLYNTGQLPKFKDDLFKTNDDYWLIPTTEVPLTNLVANEFLDKLELPLRYTGLSLCFRSEAGATGKDTKGMIRQHQFYKVELVSVTTADQSEAELEYITSCAEQVLQLLELPYRTMLLCVGDMGFSAAKTYDIEVWLPGQNSYREISSCSNCTDFQARRMNAKIKDKITGEISLVHTLNGSGLAVGRTLIAILENYQCKDGSIKVPKVLIPYMQGKMMIKK